MGAGSWSGAQAYKRGKAKVRIDKLASAEVCARTRT